MVTKIDAPDRSGLRREMTGASTNATSAARHAHRAAGQVAALAVMLDQGRPFPEIAQQLLAARGSLDALLVRALEGELCTCVRSESQRADVIHLLRAAVGRSGLPTADEPTADVPVDRDRPGR